MCITRHGNTTIDAISFAIREFMKMEKLYQLLNNHAKANKKRFTFFKKLLHVNPTLYEQSPSHPHKNLHP